MNVAADSLFQTELAKKAYGTASTLEKELRTTQKKLPPSAPECDFLRVKLRKLYEDVIFLDFSFAHEQGIENSLWVKVHHKTIESYRSRINKFNAAHGKSRPVEYRKLLLSFTSFVKDACKFYRQLIQKLIVTFQCAELYHVLKVLKTDIPGPDTSRPEGFSAELNKLVVRSCHLSLIYLGDLSRYRELVSSSKNVKKNWGPALGYYQLARKLIPNAGMPLNQLAVVAVYGEDGLASIYYFQRAICAHDPFPTAKDNLNLGYKKILTRGIQKQNDLIDRFLHLHASLQLIHVDADFVTESRVFLSSLHRNITERLVSSEVLSQMSCINIATAHTCSNAVGPMQGNLEKTLTFNIDFMLLLLRALQEELMKITGDDQDLFTQISPITRQLLVSLRIYSKWFSINMTRFRPLWTKYVKTMTLLGSRFPRHELPNFDGPLSEDIDLRGFAPIEGGLRGSPLQEIASSSHPNREMLIRISALLTDAADVAEQIDRELNPRAGTIPTTGLGNDERAPTLLTGSPLKLSTIQKSSVVAPTKASKVLSDSRVQGGPDSRASEASIAFSLNKMVDSLVAQPEEDEELIFRGRQNLSPRIKTTGQNALKWAGEAQDSTLQNIWSKSVP